MCGLTITNGQLVQAISTSNLKPLQRKEGIVGGTEFCASKVGAISAVESFFFVLTFSRICRISHVLEIPVLSKEATCIQ